jgi:hypothetical protein
MPVLSEQCSSASRCSVFCWLCNSNGETRCCRESSGPGGEQCFSSDGTRPTGDTRRSMIEM